MGCWYGYVLGRVFDGVCNRSTIMEMTILGLVGWSGFLLVVGLVLGFVLTVWHES